MNAIIQSKANLTEEKHNEIVSFFAVSHHVQPDCNFQI